MPIRIHIADDHAVFRSGLKAFIEKQDDLIVVGESGDVSGTEKWMAENEVDVLILDINMPGPPAFQLVENIKKQYPEVSVLVLTMHDEEHYLKEFFRLGAKGFMVKSSTGDELVQAIRKIYQGHDFIDPTMSKFMISNYLGKSQRPAGSLELLTGREQDVCRLLALGHTNTEAAKALSISRRTVEAHRAAIMGKMKFSSRAELVQFALDNNLLKH